LTGGEDMPYLICHMAYEIWHIGSPSDFAKARLILKGILYVTRFSDLLLSMRSA
jgi:hypothetical protein